MDFATVAMILESGNDEAALIAADALEELGLRRVANRVRDFPESRDYWLKQVRTPVIIKPNSRSRDTCSDVDHSRRPEDSSWVLAFAEWNGYLNPNREVLSEQRASALLSRVIPEWCEKNQPRFASAETIAYANLICAYGHARLNQRPECERQLSEASLVLNDRNDLHELLLEAFREKIQNEFSLHGHESGIAPRLLTRLEQLPRMERYAVDRLRQYSWILEPNIKVDARLPWRISSSDPAVIANSVVQHWESLPNKQIDGISRFALNNPSLFDRDFVEEVFSFLGSIEPYTELVSALRAGHYLNDKSFLNALQLGRDWMNQSEQLPSSWIPVVDGLVETLSTPLSPLVTDAALSFCEDLATKIQTIKDFNSYDENQSYTQSQQNRMTKEYNDCTPIAVRFLVLERFLKDIL